MNKNKLNKYYQQRCRFFDNMENYIYNVAFEDVSVFDYKAIDKINKLVSKIEQLYENEHKENYSKNKVKGK